MNANVTVRIDSGDSVRVPVRVIGSATAGPGYEVTVLSQAAYDALPVKYPTRIYIII